MIIVLFVVLSILFLIIEIGHWSVFGGIVPEKDIEIYLNKYLSNSILNPYNDSMFSDMPKYISAGGASILSRWYIEDYGMIFRWSKCSKVLDARHKELKKIKKLSDL